MSAGTPLDADSVRALFQELSDRLAAAGVTAQLFVVGGAAMALGYDGGRVTRDVDAVFVPAPEVRRIAEEMSGPHGLEPDWLNDAAKGFLPGPDEHPRTVFESESLLVQVPSPEYLLAMKLLASRDDRDLDDAALLCTRLGFTSPDECIDLLTAAYPAAQLLPRHRYVADEVIARARAAGHDDAPRTSGAAHTAAPRLRPFENGFGLSADGSRRPPRLDPRRPGRDL